MGIMIRLAMHREYDLLLPTMEKVGFIRKGEQLSIEAIDEMPPSTWSPSRCRCSTTPASGCRSTPSRTWSAPCSS